MKKAVFALFSAALLATPAAAQERPSAAEQLLRQLIGENQRGGWEIGPYVRGRSYSPGMPARARSYGEGFTFDFPTRPQHHVHYVTRPVGSLANAQSITVRYRIDAARGTRFVPQEYPNLDGTVSLYFQRAGDNWSGSGAYQYYRWFAPPAQMQRLAPGEFQFTVSLDDPRWVAVSGNAMNAPAAFEAAKARASRVGLVFGSARGRGHGVYTTAPARITVTDFNIR